MSQVIHGETSRKHCQNMTISERTNIFVILVPGLITAMINWLLLQRVQVKE